MSAVKKKQVILEVSNKDKTLPTALGRGNGLSKAGKTPGVGEPPSQWGMELCKHGAQSESTALRNPTVHKAHFWKGRQRRKAHFLQRFRKSSCQALLLHTKSTT